MGAIENYSSGFDPLKCCCAPLAAVAGDILSDIWTEHYAAVDLYCVLLEVHCS